MALLKAQVPMIRAEFKTRLANLNKEMQKEINNHQGTLISSDGKTNVSFNYDGAKTLFLDAHSSGNIDTGFWAKIKAIFTEKLPPLANQTTKSGAKLDTNDMAPLVTPLPVIVDKNPAPVVPPVVPPGGLVGTGGLTSTIPITTEPAQGNIQTQPIIDTQANQNK